VYKLESRIKRNVLFILEKRKVFLKENKNFENKVRLHNNSATMGSQQPEKIEFLNPAPSPFILTLVTTPPSHTVSNHNYITIPKFNH